MSQKIIKYSLIFFVLAISLDNVHGACLDLVFGKSMAEPTIDVFKGKYPTLNKAIYQLIHKKSNFHEIFKLVKEGDSPKTFFRDIAGFLKFNKAPRSFPSNISDQIRSGPLIVYSNHPLSIFDTFEIAGWLEEFRSDIKILVKNDLSLDLKNSSYKDLFISYPKSGKNLEKNNQNKVRALLEIKQHLMRNGCLLIFPGGESKSTFNFFKTSVDGQWKEGISDIALIRPDTKILPVFIERETPFLYAASLRLHPVLALPLRVREHFAFNPNNSSFIVGDPFFSQKIFEVPVEERISFLRSKVYKMGKDFFYSHYRNVNGSPTGSSNSEFPLLSPKEIEWVSF